MRIAYLNADCGIALFGNKGACVHIEEMVRAMERCGADVRIVATRTGGDRPAGFDTPVIHAASGREADAAGSRRSKEERNMADAAAAAAALVQMAAENPLDMIYERYSLWSTAGVEAARKLGVPLVLEVNAPLLLEQERHRALDLYDTAERIEHACMTGADAIVTVSRQMRDYAISRGAAADRVIVAGNAVDTNRFRPNVTPADLGIPADAHVVGFTGSLKDWHGIDHLLEGFRIVRESLPNAHLLIVGDGPQRGWIEGFVRGARLRDAVTMTGWLPHEALPAAIAAMDVAVAPYPSLDQFYFSPLKLFEYLAMGRPVVASGIGQIAEVIAGGENGLLVPPGDPARLANAIVNLHGDRALAGRLAAAAAEEGARHDWLRNARMVLALGNTFRKAA